MKISFFVTGVKWVQKRRSGLKKRIFCDNGSHVGFRVAEEADGCQGNMGEEPVRAFFVREAQKTKHKLPSKGKARVVVSRSVAGSIKKKLKRKVSHRQRRDSRDKRTSDFCPFSSSCLFCGR